MGLAVQPVVEWLGGDSGRVTDYQTQVHPAGAGGCRGRRRGHRRREGGRHRRRRHAHRPDRHLRRIRPCSARRRCASPARMTDFSRPDHAARRRAGRRTWSRRRSRDELVAAALAVLGRARGLDDPRRRLEPGGRRRGLRRQRAARREPRHRPGDRRRAAHPRRGGRAVGCRGRLRGRAGARRHRGAERDPRDGGRGSDPEHRRLRAAARRHPGRGRLPRLRVGRGAHPRRPTNWGSATAPARSRAAASAWCSASNSRCTTTAG